MVAGLRNDSQQGSTHGPRHAWAPDGRTLLFGEQQDPFKWTSGCCGSTSKSRYLSSRHASMNSGRGLCRTDRGMTYVSDESGRFEVYVQPITGGGAKVPISTEGGTEPVWNRNGRELFYLSGDRLMAVDVSAGSRFSVTRQRLLFEGGFDTVVADAVHIAHQYDVTPDGHRVRDAEERRSAGHLTERHLELVHDASRPRPDRALIVHVHASASSRGTPRAVYLSALRMDRGHDLTDSWPRIA